MGEIDKSKRLLLESVEEDEKFLHLEVPEGEIWYVDVAYSTVYPASDNATAVIAVTQEGLLDLGQDLLGSSDKVEIIEIASDSVGGEANSDTQEMSLYAYGGDRIVMIARENVADMETYIDLDIRRVA